MIYAHNRLLKFILSIPLMKNLFSFLLGLFSKPSQPAKVEGPTIRELELIQEEHMDLSDEAYYALCDEILRNEPEITSIGAVSY
tara:strand:+ start:603 stop:854 length:252 start_codon:yes stop_codon:yes gene_type:complete